MNIHPRLKTLLPGAVCFVILTTCMFARSNDIKEAEALEKPVIYQVFTRLFGNTKETFVPWGTLEQNGVGKFADFTDTALKGIRELGTTHIWYTGVPHHALVRDYRAIGLSCDDPDVVKGRAGSPYAVKDYYQVNPDLAVDPAQRLQEFDALIARTHAQGMKVLIDIVPNHIARRYEGRNNPPGVEDFGTKDDTRVQYARDNNFYYLPGLAFEVPDLPGDIRPLGGEPHPLADGKFEEIPAKWTGNGARKAKPAADDWYETVKINYGVRPDGTHDFASLPAGFASLSYAEHAAFWAEQDVPDSWRKFLDIVHFWLDRGVDGFRYDMAEMVPVEFWSFLNSSIKMRRPDALLLAEVYQPALFRDYLHLGKMDYLYDKVDLYDTLKAILKGEAAPLRIAEILDAYTDVSRHLLHFLENHDEQRIASPEFAGDPFRALPLMVVSATLSDGCTMLYFGQEVGEDGSENAGFGRASRTSIFDYIGVPAHQRWMNGGAFDGGLLTAQEKRLRRFYIDLLQLTRSEPALMGDTVELHRFNHMTNPGYPANDVFAYVRTSGKEQLVVAVNFSDSRAHGFDLHLPKDTLHGLTGAGPHGLMPLLGGDQDGGIDASRPTHDQIRIELAPSGYRILKWVAP
jgi:glycosidase